MTDEADPPPLPARFPVFPLPGAVLLPGARLPLHIFEPRYRAMTNDILAGERYLGMILPNVSAPSGVNGPGLHRVGCLGRLIAFAEQEDSRYLINLAGICRFTVAEELEPHHGYRQVRGDFTAYRADRDPPSSTAHFDRAEVFEALRVYCIRHKVDARFGALDTLPDSLLIATLTMVCPFSDTEKQALLEASDIAARADALLTLLLIDQHESDDEPARRPS